MTTRKPGFEEEPVPFEGAETHPSRPEIPFEAKPDHSLDADSVSRRLITRFPKILAKLAE